MTITFKLDCGVASKFSKKLDALVPTGEVILRASFKPVTPAWNCLSHSFPSGTFMIGGSGTVRAGNSNLGMSLGIYADAFFGLNCDSAYQRYGFSSRSIRVGMKVLVSGTVTVSGQTTPKAFYQEPTPDSSCSQKLTGNGILPDGIGYKDSDGNLWNVVDTKYGTCY